MSYFTRSIRGSLAVFGVAVGLIGTAGAASAQEATPASEDSAVVAEDEAAVASSSAQGEEANVGDALLIERPAPRPDPANELRSDAAAPSAPAAVPAPARSSSPSGGAVAPTAVPAPAPAAVTASAAPAPAVVAPARATEVQGIQIQRTDTGAVATAPLAFTGPTDLGLLVVASVLLVLGSVLVIAVRPRRTI